MPKKEYPNYRDVKSLRETVQDIQGLSITEAQDVCADLVHTSRRSWQQWEAGERRMHPAFWELARLKATDLTA